MELRKNSHCLLLYNTHLIHKFIRKLSKNGKIHKLTNAFFVSLTTLKFQFKLNPLILCLFILNEIKPYVLLKTLRLGSSTYKVPVPVAFRKQYYQAIKLLVMAIRHSKFKGSLHSKITNEFILVLKGLSSLLKANLALYKAASDSRSFLHYRWD